MHPFHSDFLAFQIHCLPAALSNFMIFKSNPLKRNASTVSLPRGDTDALSSVAWCPFNGSQTKTIDL